MIPYFLIALFMVIFGLYSYLVVAKHDQAEWISVESLIQTELSGSGFGHNGKK
jgi:hypothetical protein